MRYTRLDPPAFLDDFTTEEQRDAWSERVSSYFNDGIAFNLGFPIVASQFYHPVNTETDEPFEEPVIDWPAFPKLVKDRFPTDPRRAWRTAEADLDARLKRMDEYLEWHVVRNEDGKITRVSFTCETREYFEFLARADPEKLLDVYRSLVDPAVRDAVRAEDLVSDGAYQPRNRWNTEHGAVHLIQPNNNLYAEVMIAAQACVLRQREDGTPITDSDELIECAGYGEPGRSSDPKIGAIVNEKAREGYAISLRNPVALYITNWRTSGGWRKPDGSPVGNYWKLVRGKPAPAPNRPAMGLHLVYEVPPEENFVVGDIRVGSRTIEHGGEIAEQINVGLYGLLCRPGQTSNPAFRCGGQPGAADGQARGAAVDRPPLRGRKRAS